MSFVPKVICPLLVLGLVGTGCPPADDEDAIPTGIEVQPPDQVDFGTIHECTEHQQDLLIINHGPDTEEVTIDADSLLYQGFLIGTFQPDVTLDAGDEYLLVIKASPGAGGAGVREAAMRITTLDRIIEIQVKAEVVAGEYCEEE